mmetsp:Transcript_13563/g.34812  ORF Transcript_13563/g.34812 Transcript_13563/m.34812 type:complete len:160 (+) Transcript_13563:892-1371(+)
MLLCCDQCLLLGLLLPMPQGIARLSHFPLLDLIFFSGGVEFLVGLTIAARLPVTIPVSHLTGTYTETLSCSRGVTTIARSQCAGTRKHTKARQKHDKSTSLVLAVSQDEKCSCEHRTTWYYVCVTTRRARRGGRIPGRSATSELQHSIVWRMRILTSNT